MYWILIDVDVDQNEPWSAYGSEDEFDVAEETSCFYRCGRRYPISSRSGEIANILSLHYHYIIIISHVFFFNAFFRAWCIEILNWKTFYWM